MHKTLFFQISITLFWNIVDLHCFFDNSQFIAGNQMIALTTQKELYARIYYAQ